MLPTQPDDQQDLGTGLRFIDDDCRAVLRVGSIIKQQPWALNGARIFDLSTIEKQQSVTGRCGRLLKKRSICSIDRLPLSRPIVSSQLDITMDKSEDNPETKVCDPKRMDQSSPPNTTTCCNGSNSPTKNNNKNSIAESQCKLPCQVCETGLSPEHAPPSSSCPP